MSTHITVLQVALKARINQSASDMPKAAPAKYSLYDESVPLPSVYKKRAAKELKEVPDQVSAHLESFRRWLKSMPHLKCPTRK